MSENKPSIEELILKADAEYEKSWNQVLEISKWISFSNDSKFAVRRLLAYNPLNPSITHYEPKLKNPVGIVMAVADEIIKSIAENPEKPDLWVRLGHCYLAINDFPNANAAYARVKALIPNYDNTFFWYAYGIVNQHFGYYTDAGECYTKSAKCTRQINFGNDYLFKLAILYRSTGYYDDSLAMLNKLLKDTPSKMTADDIQFQIAYTNQLAGRSDLAFKKYEELFQRYPNVVEVCQQFLWFISISGKKEYYEKGKIIMNSLPQKLAQDQTVQLACARICLETNDLTDSYNRFCECLAYWNDNPILWCGLSDLYYINQQYQDADVALDRVICLNNQIPEVWLNISFIAEKNNDKREAIKKIQKGIEACPKSDILKQRLNELEKGKSTLSMVRLSELSFITQPAEKEAIRRLSDPVPIPPEEIYPQNPNLAEALKMLMDRYDSIFTAN